MNLCCHPYIHKKHQSIINIESLAYQQSFIRPNNHNKNWKDLTKMGTRKLLLISAGAFLIFSCILAPINVFASDYPADETIDIHEVDEKIFVDDGIVIEEGVNVNYDDDIDKEIDQEIDENLNEKTGEEIDEQIEEQDTRQE
jgi:hypothetical protein